MLGARRADDGRARAWFDGRRGRGRHGGLDRRVWAALVGVLGILFAIAANVHRAGVPSRTLAVGEAPSGAWASGGAEAPLADGVRESGERGREFARDETFGGDDGGEESTEHIDLDALNAQLSGSVWDFNEARPKSGAQKAARSAGPAREAQPLPSLGQKRSSKSRRSKDVTEGESRSGSSTDKDASKSKAGTTQPGLALSDSEIYDPAFVDDEFEHGKRSGKDLVKRFLNPPLLNTTWDTGRLRRLGRTLYLDGKPWLMRAVCYSPVPVGWDPDWFEPYGDFFTNDYSGIFERDIPLMAAAGVNTMRIYTLKFSKRHKEFFDMAHAYNISVLVGYDFEDGTKSFFNTAETMEETQLELRKLVRSAKHPAVVGWIVGNELNGPWNLYVCDSELAENFGVSGCQFEDSIEKLMKSVNMLCGTVRSENMLCGTAIANVNLPRTKQHLVGRQLWGALSWIKLADRYMDQIDFWGVNLYTRRYFSPMGLFQRYHLVSKRPFLITEYGVDAFSLNPQLEGLNGYDTMGDEDEISQADWLSTMVEDIERYSTSCKAGCGVRFTSGGAIMAWVDEYWKGKAVTPVPTNDERIPTITRVCPSLKEYLHSPCGYMSPTQPDLYVSEEWFGIMAVEKKCSINKVDLLRPRAAYFMLKLLWKDGGSCTIHHGQNYAPAYDTDMFPDCSKSMKNYHNRTMHLFVRAEAEAFHEIKLGPNEPTPIYAHFENFSAILTHPKGTINPVSTALQSTFLSCHHMNQIHRKSERLCPQAPQVFNDLGTYVNQQKMDFEQPGDTSCPDRESIDALKLEVQFVTVVKVAGSLYLGIALLLRWRVFRRSARDAVVSLSRSKLPLLRLIVRDDRAIADVQKRAERVIRSPSKQSRRFEGNLSNESPPQDEDELSLARIGPEPSGSSTIEREIGEWKTRIVTVTESLADVFGFQRASEEFSSTRENCVEKCALLLWNTCKLRGAPKAKTSEWAISQLHSKMFAGYMHYIQYTGIDFSPRGSTTLASAMQNGNTDTKLCQIVLFELITQECANLRFLPEFMMFVFHLMASTVSNIGATCSVVQGAVRYDDNDFVDSIVTPLYKFLVMHAKSAAPLHLRMGYDDMNETFLDVAKLRKMLSMEAETGTSYYAKFRQFLRVAGAAKEKDQSLSSVFKKTYREHLGWTTMFVNFHRFFVLLALLMHVMVVHAFTGFSRPELFSTMAVTAAVLDLFLESRVIFFDRMDLFHARIESVSRAAFAMAVLLLGVALLLQYINETTFAVVGVPYTLLALANIAGYHLSSVKGIGKSADSYFTGRVSKTASPRERRMYILFWLAIFTLKLTFDYILMVNPLVMPTKAILQIDLYCWNYDFSGADCDMYDHNEMLSPRFVEMIRLSRRYGFKFLMLFERWLPNVLLYFGNTFLYYVVVLGASGAVNHYRQTGVATGWARTVVDMPSKIDVFCQKVLTTQQKPVPESDAATALCGFAVSDGWLSFSRVWNEVVKSLRLRDLLSDDEVNLLSFRELSGRTSESFFGSRYVIFPTMLTGPLFSNIGIQRNEKMRFEFASAVVSQTIDLCTFISICVLDIVDSTNRVHFSELLKSLTELVSLALCEHSQGIKWLTFVRAETASLIKLLVIDGVEDEIDVKEIKSRIQSVFKFIVSEIAKDREQETATHRQTNSLIAQTCSQLESLINYDKLDAAGSKIRTAAISRSGSFVIKQLNLALSTANPSGEPSIEEAKDALRFFITSLGDPALPGSMTVTEMPMMTTLTPVYTEEIRTSLDTLTQAIDGESVSGFRFMVSMAPTSWMNMLERTKVKVKDSNYELFFDRALLDKNTALSTFTDEERRLTTEAINWASGEGQTLYRTVRGFAAYADALRILARLEGIVEDEIEALVRAKYEHVLCCQVYNSPGYTMNDEVEALVVNHRHVKVNYVQQPNEESTDYYIVKMERGADGKCERTHRIRIPGHPIVGEGKPENQNMGLVWCRGQYIQTIDMNQDSQLTEGLKLRNALSVFETSDDVTLIGFTEQLISGRQGSVASFAAKSETVFGTMLQRFMTRPLRVRLHYGHPDIWEGAFVRSCGGVSKATKKLHLSEDVYGGMNVLQRGGKIEYANFLTCGKGREVSFDGNNQFNKKIATGNGMQLISRDFHRLAKSMDIFRCMSFFQSSVGMFYTEFMLVASMVSFVLCKTLISMFSIETYYSSGDAFDNVGFHQEIGFETLYPSQWMLQASMVMAWPSMLHGWITGGLVHMLRETYQDMASGSFVYHMFIAKSRGHAIDASISSGDATYRGTKRNMSMNASFSDLYMQYGDSHIIPAFAIMFMTVLLTELSNFSAKYVFFTTTWHIWVAVSLWMFSPWFFHPQTLKEGVPAYNFNCWIFWLDALKAGDVSRLNKDGTWWSWQSKRLRALRAMPRHLKVEYLLIRVLPLPIILIVSSTAALRTDSTTTAAILRGIVVTTSGVAGVLLSGIYYLSTSPTFLWPQRFVNIGMRTKIISSESEKRCLLLAYNMLVRIVVVLFHHLLCERLFSDVLDSRNRQNAVVFTMCGLLSVQCIVQMTALISDSPLPMFKQVAYALRSFSDFYMRDADECIGLMLHASIALTSLLPVSYVHAKLLFNRAYASVLGLEMRRRTLVNSMNKKNTSNVVKNWLLSSRTFIRKVLGLRAAPVRYVRPVPSTIPNLDDDLTQIGVMKKSSERIDEIKRRLMPIATHLATLFGFQKTAKDSTYSVDEVEVPSNLWNSLESLATWLENLLTQKEDVDGDSIDHLNQYWSELVNELHSHLFQNYSRWVAYTGLVDSLGRASVGDETSTLLSVYMTDANELWSRESREQTMWVKVNAKLHHLCLWFLIYGESANLRHTSESLCFIFHTALCAVTLEGRRPNEDEEFVLCKPVSEEVMPYEEKDFLHTIVTPLYLFLKREIAERTTAPISERVMYDDVNEFFWRYDALVRVLPPEVEPERSDEDANYIGVPKEMAGLSRDARMYEHLRSFLKNATATGDAATALSNVFFKTHRETSGWLSMFVNFNSVIVFHAVAFHLSAAYVFAHGWNWSYLCTATVTHALLKFLQEVASIRFRNLSSERFADWLVLATRASMFGTIPVFYLIESMSRSDHGTPYFEGLAAVYAVASSGLMSSMIRRTPFVGSAAQMSTPIRERMIYTAFWFVVLSTKMIFGHFLLIAPLREAISALTKGDLCWNKESDEYTSCINLEGDALVEALKFKPKVTYFTEVKNSEDDYDESDIQLSYYEPIPERRRSLLFSHGGGGDFTGASWGDESQFATDLDLNESVDPYNGQYRGWSSGASKMSSIPQTRLESALSGVSEAAANALHDAIGHKKLTLPALGYIGEEIEGQLPEAYYDVHASQFLMSVLVVARMLPAIATYFCDTFLWYTLYASLFTIFLQWRGKVSHAQRWAKFLRNFQQIPNLFCEKLTNKAWPKMVMISSDGADADGLDDGDADVPFESQARQRSGGGYAGDSGVHENLLDAVALTVTEDEVLLESGTKSAKPNPADFLPEAMDIKWQHFARGWNSIVDSLRARDHITNKERTDLKFTFLRGHDVEQIFDAPEYIVMPPMMTSSVFSRANFNTGTMAKYPSFGTTLVQTKDLLCVLMTEVLRVVSPGDLSLLMRIVSDLATIEGEQMQQRRRDDIDGYLQLRDSIVKLLLTLQAMSESTEATPIEEDYNDRASDDDESASDDEEAQLRLLGDIAGAERARLRKEQRTRRRQLKLLKEKTQERQKQMVEAINLEMKFGCTGLISKERRKKMKEKSGLMRGCFVVQENWDEMTDEQRALLEDSQDQDQDKPARKRWRKGRRRLIKWSNIQSDADIEAQSSTLAEALHEVLLAVRTIFSFSMESSARWSSVNNQRKYRVSQLYVQLLELVRIDALRDMEHMRVVSASATLATNRKIVESLLNSMNNINPGGEPRNLEARRQLMFFTNSLNFTTLKAPTKLHNMRAWTAFTPYYAEEVSYRKDELVRPLEDQKTLLSIIQATYPDEYENFKERIGALSCDDTTILDEHWNELRVWTSDHTQSLSRCVRGICYYGTALRFLARLEGYDEDHIERLVHDKFEYLVSCQVYGRMLSAPMGSADRQKAEDINELIFKHPELRVCFVQNDADRFSSCLIGCERETNTLSIACKVELPGNPIIGEGKPENQNHAVIFSRGSYLQTLDMNQDGYFAEALKMRNLLDVFSEDVVLVGFPEVIFSETTGAVAQFAAISEFIFQTFQRFMTWPLMVRFHYGHPDLWDKAFTMTNGGVSKASKMIHVAEDFFGGVNAIVRGGRVIFEEFIEVGKGRDMGFTSVNGFEQKISGSAGTISMSRDVYRLHRSMDFFRVLSMYFSGPGFFISVMQTAWCVYLYILVHAGLAIADLEIYRIYRYFKMTETQTTLSLSKEEGGYYNSIYAIQLGLLTVLPLFLKMVMDRGLRDGVEYTLSSLLRGSWAFNIFAMTTKGYNYMVGLIFGKAQYIATERGYVLQNANMVVLYGLYAKSHLYFGMEVLFLLILFHTNTVLPKSLLYSWSVWSFGVCIVITPWWFSPQSTNLYWMQRSWADWRSWLDGTFDKPKIANGSWDAWHREMSANYRNRIGFFIKTGIVFMSCFGRIIIALVITGSLHGSTLYTGLTQTEQFAINAGRVGAAAVAMGFVAIVYEATLNSVVFKREPWLDYPDKLWKISIYRGVARVGMFIIWNGLYFFALHVDTGSNSLARTWFMTGLAAACVLSMFLESFVMLSDDTLTSFGESWLPVKPLDGEPEPRGNAARRLLQPFIYRTRSTAVTARKFADFWFKEMDKFFGLTIFVFIFCLSLLPVATMQTVLIWNETFSDIVSKKIAVQETVSSILD